MQSKKRGLSLEDKRTALLSLFHETKEPYVLKASYSQIGRESDLPIAIADFTSSTGSGEVGTQEGGHLAKRQRRPASKLVSQPLSSVEHSSYIEDPITGAIHQV